MNTGFLVTANQYESPTCLIFQPKNSLGQITRLAEDDRSGTFVVLMGSLHYRSELAIRLGNIELTEEVTDAEFVKALYERSGTRYLSHLEGDFSFLIYDGQKKVLIVRRDPMGAWPLFWSCKNGIAKVGTRIIDVAPEHRESNLSLEYIASFLMVNVASPELRISETVIRDVSRIAPGDLVRIDCNKGMEVLEKWNWSSMLTEPMDISLDDAIDGVHSILSTAIQERMGNGKVGSHLSGGLDSSSVTCIARDQFANAEKPLSTFSLVYDMPSLYPEREYIESVIQQKPGIAPVLILGDKHLDFEWFDGKLPFHNEPYIGLYQIAASKALYSATAQQGCTRVLTGLGADDLYEGNRLHLADLLRSGRLLLLRREVMATARSLNTSGWDIFARHALAPNLPYRLRDGIRTTLRNGYGSWPDLGSHSVPPWVLGPFAKQFACLNRGAELQARLQSPFAWSSIANMLHGTAGDWFAWNLGGTLGIETSHPFRDQRVIKFAINLPREYREVSGRRKFLLQEAMNNSLPEKIRRRRFKRFFNDPHGRGLSRNLDSIIQMINTSDISKLGILDPRSLSKCVTDLAMGAASFRAGNRVCASLSLIAWYDRFQKEASRSKCRSIFRTSDKVQFATRS